MNANDAKTLQNRLLWAVVGAKWSSVKGRVVPETGRAHAGNVNGLGSQCGNIALIDRKGLFRAPPAPARHVNTGRPAVSQGGWVI